MKKDFSFVDGGDGQIITIKKVFNSRIQIKGNSSVCRFEPVSFACCRLFVCLLFNSLTCGVC
jgi:hypothetical protein